MSEVTNRSAAGTAFRGIKLLVGGYFAISLGALAVLGALHGHRSVAPEEAWVHGVIVAITAIVSIALAAYAWHRAPNAGLVEKIAGGAVVGGAIANVIDRARDGVVTDYLHTGWWPTFNLADTFLVTGFIVLAVMHARPERTAAKEPESITAHPATTVTGDP